MPGLRALGYQCASHLAASGSSVGAPNADRGARARSSTTLARRAGRLRRTRRVEQRRDVVCGQLPRPQRQRDRNRAERSPRARVKFPVVGSARLPRPPAEPGRRSSACAGPTEAKRSLAPLGWARGGSQRHVSQVVHERQRAARRQRRHDRVVGATAVQPLHGAALSAQGELNAVKAERGGRRKHRRDL